MLSASNKKEDSLKVLINKPVNNWGKLNLIPEFCEENSSYSYDTLTRYADTAFTLSRQTNNSNDKARAAYFKALDLLITKTPLILPATTSEPPPV